MAHRSRANRNEIPGYVPKPSRDDRRQQHRATRHATHQVLHSLEDLDDVVLPESRGSKPTPLPTNPVDPAPRRFRVWKTKFWKRRDRYQDTKAAMDASWPVITPEQLAD